MKGRCSEHEFVHFACQPEGFEPRRVMGSLYTTLVQTSLPPAPKCRYFMHLQAYQMSISFLNTVHFVEGAISPIDYSSVTELVSMAISSY